MQNYQTLSEDSKQFLQPGAEPGILFNAKNTHKEKLDTFDLIGSESQCSVNSHVKRIQGLGGKMHKPHI